VRQVSPGPWGWVGVPLAVGLRPVWAVSLSSGWVALVSLAAAAAGAIASVAGFGIGSILTPLVAWQEGTKFAVAAVSIPHLAGTAVRCWRLRGHIDRRVLLSFGLASAAGGLLGALLHAYVQSPVLAVVLGVLLVFAGLTELTGLAERLRLRGPWAWAAGAASGGFGGLVGNQGGIRSAALLGFDLPRQSFVATATAIALVVDGVRLPAYLVFQGEELLRAWPLIALATAGVVAGTLAGERVLRQIPEPVFRRVVAALILALGVVMFFEAGR
jgi:uncharacterized membrane protein YfcA